jgi:hypothetical protein
VQVTQSFLPPCPPIYGHKDIVLVRSPRDLKEIAASVHGTALAWSHTDESLGLSEFRTILTTLKYDGFVEETRPVPGSRHALEGDPTFRVVGKATGHNSLTTVPCGQCPVCLYCMCASTVCDVYFMVA